MGLLQTKTQHAFPCQVTIECEIIAVEQSLG